MREKKREVIREGGERGKKKKKSRSLESSLSLIMKMRLKENPVMKKVVD